VFCVVGFLLVAMAMLIIQHQALSRFRQENDSLRRQGDESIAQAHRLGAENGRFSMLLIASTGE
jgi:hypothetical protein